MGTPGPSTRYDLVVVTDRLPVERVAGTGGQYRWCERADGLVGALRSVVAVRRGAWLGAAEADTATVEPFTHDKLWLHPLPPSDRATDEDHNEFCATTLAPMYHDCARPETFHRRWHAAYCAANQRFADRAAEVAAPGGVVWVHDLHLQLVPDYLRRMRPDLLIGFFMHSPFPPAELFLRLPMREQIIRGLLGSDLVGFQHARAAANFVELTGQLLAVPIGNGTIETAGRRVGVGVFPMSIDVAEVERLADDAAVRATAAALRAELGHRRTLLLAVTTPAQLDGAQQLLDAYHELLAERSVDPQQTVLVLVAPSGSHAAQRHLPDLTTSGRVAEINARHHVDGSPAVHYVHRALSRSDLVAMYVAADVMLATPLRAGAALPAKEYVAARTDNSGYLVLSELTSTATDLHQAHTVNPHDTEALKAAILAAVRVTDDQAARSMARMREQVRATDANGWAGRFLAELGDRVAAAFQPAPGPAGHAPPPTGPTASGRHGATPRRVPVSSSGPRSVTPAGHAAAIRACR